MRELNGFLNCRIKVKIMGFFFKKYMYINFTVSHTNNGVISLLLIQLKPQKHISTGP